MQLPEYKLVGTPTRFVNGRGRKGKCYAQKFRLLRDPARRVRSVSLKTTDAAAGRRHVVTYVEARVREIVQRSDPRLRIVSYHICEVLQEYIDDLVATGNTSKPAKLVKNRIELVIEAAAFSEHAEVDAVRVAKAIAKLQSDKVFSTTTTANKYREAMRAWSRWMKKNGRSSTNPLEDMPKIKGDTSNSRPRAILSDKQFEQLLRATRVGPERRRLNGEQRYWLYLLGSLTGLRAQELNSLTPASFHLDVDPPYVEVHCTISKRRTTDRVLLRREFAEMIGEWLSMHDADQRLWGGSRSWWYKASSLVRLDLQAAGISHQVETDQGTAVIDFHSFRAYRVTNAILTGKSSRVVMATVRLSCESLLDRYFKIPSSEITACTDMVPLPNLKP